VRLDALFWVLVLVAIGATGREAVLGLPTLAHLLTPSLPHAEAGLREPRAYAEFSRPIGSETHHSTQVLQPVTAGLIPEWLLTRRRVEPVPQVLPTAPDGGAPKIAIVIDDMGNDVEQSQRAITLPKAVTLSFLPYPATAPGLARAALREGHEVLVHVPMQPEGREDPGPNALRTDLSAAENVRRLELNLSRIAGFDGINNHEGSRFTASRVALAPVMAGLAQRGVFFLDSRTGPQTQVVEMARAAGIESASRDVFLDDTDKPDAIDAQLRLAEKVAREQGVVIAIGHPRYNTLGALWRWCGEATSRGYTLIPVREAIRLKMQREVRAAAR
jgi:polysaccharide deacetylase 2 family uncharacterized protein YibQ